MQQTDSFLAVEKGLFKRFNCHVFDEEPKIEDEIAQFPAFCSETIERLSKCEFNLSGFNCENFDFIKAALKTKGSPMKSSQSSGDKKLKSLKKSTSVQQLVQVTSPKNKKFSIVAFGSTARPQEEIKN